MNVFLTGTTGYIGGSVLDALRARGHHVLALARSEVATMKLVAKGASVVRGTLFDSAIITRAARESDGAIHTATSNGPDTPQADQAAVAAIIKGLEGSGKPFVYTSGIWVHGPTGDRVADESTPLNPATLVAWRPAHEQMVLASTQRGVRASVIRPAIVYGRGVGMVADLVRSAREIGAVKIVGPGQNRWPLVQVDDLADLYVRMLESAQAGSIYLVAQGPALTLRTIAEAASRAGGAGGKVEEWPLEEARKQLGPYADALALDQQVSAEKAKRELGWTPSREGVLEDLAGGAASGGRTGAG
jgi:nucleoside-diphosphate-sugar epimerase